MTRIFLNYRRSDEPGFVHALYARLEAAFPRSVFMDVDGRIPVGEKFDDVLRRHLSEADVVIAVIGPQWLRELAGRDPERDFVVLEIRVAFDMGKRVIPVLVRHATMPVEEELPASIQQLSKLQAFVMRPDEFGPDSSRLMYILKHRLPKRKIHFFRRVLFFGFAVIVFGVWIVSSRLIHVEKEPKVHESTVLRQGDSETSVIVTTVPADARVTMDDGPVAESPAYFKVIPGRHQLKGEKSGYDTLIEHVEIPAQETPFAYQLQLIESQSASVLPPAWFPAWLQAWWSLGQIGWGLQALCI